VRIRVKNTIDTSENIVYQIQHMPVTLLNRVEIAIIVHILSANLTSKSSPGFLRIVSDFIILRGKSDRIIHCLGFAVADRARCQIPVKTVQEYNLRSEKTNKNQSSDINGRKFWISNSDCTTLWEGNFPIQWEMGGWGSREGGKGSEEGIREVMERDEQDIEGRMTALCSW
jgi:hypothetical protein